MAAGLVVRQRIAAAERDHRMVIRTEDGDIILGVPYAPQETELTGVASTWAEVARPASRPILAAAGEPLLQLAFDLVFGTRGNTSVEETLQTLRELAGGTERLIVSYGPSEGGVWHLTQMTQRGAMRDENDHINRAAVTLQFTEVSDYTVNLSPLGGGHQGSGKSKIPATHKVQKGDTLHSIAVHYYGDPKWWRAIADENKIKQPRDDEKLKPGRVLKLPPRGDEKKAKAKGKKGGKQK